MPTGLNPPAPSSHPCLDLFLGTSHHPSHLCLSFLQGRVFAVLLLPNPQGLAQNLSQSWCRQIKSVLSDFGIQVFLTLQETLSWVQRTLRGPKFEGMVS